MKQQLDNSKTVVYILIMNENNWGGSRKGAGRKATGKNTVNITLTLTKTEAELLKERAKYEGITVSKFVAKWLCLNPQ